MRGAQLDVVLSSAASDATRTILAFVVVVQKPMSFDSGTGYSEWVATTQEVEYERRQFGGQAHRLIKGWHALGFLMLGACGKCFE